MITTKKEEDELWMKRERERTGKSKAASQKQNSAAEWGKTTEKYNYATWPCLPLKGFGKVHEQSSKKKSSVSVSNSSLSILAWGPNRLPARYHHQLGTNTRKKSDGKWKMKTRIICVLMSGVVILHDDDGDGHNEWINVSWAHFTDSKFWHLKD